MKKVMLVDDEILVRENIRDCIDWEKEGFTYCGDASDGEVALPLIEQMLPDILITDIKMPFMNGLELSTIVRQRMPDTKIIILSGHDEFEYARSALRIGVEEYCLKPASSNDIIRLLHSVSEKIDQERLEKKRIEKLDLDKREQVIHSQEKLLSDLCNGLITSADAVHSASLLSIDLIAHYYAVAISDVRCLESTPAADHNLIRTTENTLHEQLALPASSSVLCYRKSRSERVWIFKGNSEAQLQQTLEQLQALSQLMSSEATIGIGSIKSRLQGVHLSFLEADEDKHWRRHSLQSLRSFGDMNSDLLDQTIFVERNQFLEFLKIGTHSQLPSFLFPFTEQLRKTQWQTSHYGYYVLNDLTLEVFRMAKEIYRTVEIEEETLRQFQQKLRHVRSGEEACEYLSRLAEQFWLWRVGSSDRYADMLSQVKTYILNNYAKDHLSLQDAAKHVCVSASHLSKVFSHETGETFMSFLTNTRIRKAMELLHSTNDKSYEVAHQVGYSDAHYFSNLFKRVTGITTREFRKNGKTDASFEIEEGELHGNRVDEKL